MPTVHREAGFDFRFFSSDRAEPCHIHVIGHGGEMKIWLRPTLRPDYSKGLSPRQAAIALNITRRIKTQLTEAWDAYFNRKNP